MKDVPRPTVELKGYRDGLHLIIAPGSAIQEIAAGIEERMAKLGNSLAGTDVSIDVESGLLGAHELTQLEQILAETYGLEIKQLIDQYTRVPQSEEESRILGAPALHQADHHDGEYTLPGEEEKTQFIRQTLRSGQVERFLEGNVIIVGDVNPGAEVIAAGDVVVLGTLRGVAHAGALGTTSSVIIAINLVPTQLRIGHFITRPPTRKQRSQARVEIARTQDDGTIVVEEFNGL